LNLSAFQEYSGQSSPKLDWTRYPNFKESEFKCSATGKCQMQPELLDRLQALRSELGKPLTITSGYRDKTHPIEAAKPVPGYHARGMAADIACGANQAYTLVALALKHGFTGIGISQKSSLPRFIHLDIREGPPLIYSY